MQWAVEVVRGRGRVRFEWGLGVGWERGEGDVRGTRRRARRGMSRCKGKEWVGDDMDADG